MEPGLHLKLPFIQTVNRIDKRFLEWDGAPVAIPTRDKTYIHVDTFARWRIDDPREHTSCGYTTNGVRNHGWTTFSAARREMQWQNTILSKDLRSDKARKPLRDENIKAAAGHVGALGVLPPIAFGRAKVEAEIKAAASVKMAEFGIALLDVRLKRGGTTTRMCRPY